MAINTQKVLIGGIAAGVVMNVIDSSTTKPTDEYCGFVLRLTRPKVAFEDRMVIHSDVYWVFGQGTGQTMPIDPCLGCFLAAKDAAGEC